ncbi:MAG TPA: DUF1385 domain-containing protein [Actinomycetota bacterium]|nr:DUF1385 domain-containing protein [Actinomycetota bacterium]
MSEAPRETLYGGQAVIEGVMMRGRRHWAVAVRKPDGDIHVESHEIRSIADRVWLLRKPFLRGVIVLGQALSIGFKALSISAHRSSPEEEQLTRGQMAVSMTLALVLFLGIFVAFPAVAFRWAGGFLGSGVLANVLEGVFRVLLLLGYLALVGRSKEIRRVFAYHGAEHKTIAAYEHDEPLEPETIDRYSTLHVRCGTNFLLIVMVLTIFVFAFFGSPGLFWRVGSRIVAIPIIAGLAYEVLRLGARFQGSGAMRALMAPGLWMQRITTNPPDHGMIEVAVASFREVLRREQEQPAAT